VTLGAAPKDDPRFWALGRLGSAPGDVMHTEAFLPARPALLERDSEVSAIRELVRSARGGTGRLLVAEGSAGIGKTRLLGEARAAAEVSGLEVVAARGTGSSRSNPAPSSPT